MKKEFKIGDIVIPHDARSGLCGKVCVITGYYYMNVPLNNIYGNPATNNQIAVGAQLKVINPDKPLIIFNHVDSINFTYLKHVEQPDIIFKELLQNG